MSPTGAGRNFRSAPKAKSTRCSTDGSRKRQIQRFQAFPSLLPVRWSKRVSAATSFYAAFRPLFCLAGRWLASIPLDHQEPDFIDQSNHSLAAAAEGPFLTTSAKPLKKGDIEPNGHTSSPIDRISASPLLFVTRPARSL